VVVTDATSPVLCAAPGTFAGQPDDAAPDLVSVSSPPPPTGDDDAPLPHIELAPARPYFQRCCINLALGLVFLAIAVSFTSVLDIYSLAGGTLGTIVLYMLPSYFVIKLAGNHSRMAPKVIFCISPFLIVLSVWAQL
jgi:hypothetical protein